MLVPTRLVFVAARRVSYWTAIKRKSKSLAVTTGTMAKAVYQDPRVVRHWAEDIRESIHHGWKWVKNGFRLFLKNLLVSRQLVWKAAMGHQLSLRESKLLTRTTSDLFKLVPFSLFIIIPFAELALPIFLRIFPNMLPSTFSPGRVDSQALARQSRARKELASFFTQVVRQEGEQPNLASVDEILTISKSQKFELENLDLHHLQKMCRMLGIEPFAFKSHVLVQLRHYVNGLQKEDRRILWEGLDTLTLSELQEALHARGMPVSENMVEMRSELEQWLRLSSHRDVPISLLLWARAVQPVKPQTESSPVAEDLFEETAERQKERAEDVERRLELLEEEVREEARTEVQEEDRQELIDRVSKLEDEIRILEEIVEIQSVCGLKPEFQERIDQLRERRRTVRLSIDDDRFYPEA